MDEVVETEEVGEEVVTEEEEIFEGAIVVGSAAVVEAEVGEVHKYRPRSSGSHYSVPISHLLLLTTCAF